jgi:hypothetical protein
MSSMSTTTIDLAQTHSSLALLQLSEEDRKVVARLKQSYPSHILAAIFQDTELSQGTKSPPLLELQSNSIQIDPRGKSTARGNPPPLPRYVSPTSLLSTATRTLRRQRHHGAIRSTSIRSSRRDLPPCRAGRPNNARDIARGGQRPPRRKSQRNCQSPSSLRRA